MIEETSQTARSKYGLLAFGAIATSVVGLTIATIPFVSPALRKFCLPYVPATDTQVKNIFRIIKKPRNKYQTLVDIGSGDGRIVLAAAKDGFLATGYELNLWLVAFSKYQAWKHGLSKSTSFKRKDLWKTDFGGYDNIVIFGIEEMMGPLGTKLENEMSNEAKIIACRYPFPNRQPSETCGQQLDTVWLYSKQDIINKVNGQ